MPAEHLPRQGPEQESVTQAGGSLKEPLIIPLVRPLPERNCHSPHATGVFVQAVELRSIGQPRAAVPT